MKISFVLNRETIFADFHLGILQLFQRLGIVCQMSFTICVYTYPGTLRPPHLFLPIVKRWNESRSNQIKHIHELFYIYIIFFPLIHLISSWMSCTWTCSAARCWGFPHQILPAKCRNFIFLLFVILMKCNFIFWKII